jgi:hypothetical protein
MFVGNVHFSPMARPRFPRPQNPQRKAASVFKHLHFSFHLQHRVSHRGQAIAFVRLSEKLRFNHAGRVGKCQELHWFAGDLVVRPLFDDEAASDDGIADVLAQFIDGTIRNP